VARCSCRIYSVIGQAPSPVYTRVYIHIGKHGHSCAEGLDREKYIKLEAAVRSFVKSKPFASPKQAALDIAQGYIQ
jgi:hypothetical protein